ncbi:MAG: type IV pilus biogenesis/stability protein PilW [Candidatus Accumulibacter vicinus]|uniref:protein O-GlcNAc transferase n=1 Tax=Candidatus Accumulibacter vicinus TaxID=2954382 RepID=A0A084XWG2_9PROT|nr:MAG: type IV pilus biogenesis/stability protein PilW [Candidatus Accumulibacter vicinus]
MAALPHLQRAVELDPQAAEAHYNLGKALQEQGEVAAAERSYRAVLHLDPDHPLARLNLGNVLLAQWRGPEGLPHYRAATRAIDDPYVQSNWPMLLNFAVEPSDEEVFAAHREFDARMIAPLAGLIVAPLNPPDPGRRLRIGYLSRDFCRHAVRYFLLPIIEHHDHQAFEICCYYFRDRADEVTELFRRHADRWVDCHDLDDDELAARIRRDGIDILVDLAGYTDRNRLLLRGPVDGGAGGLALRWPAGRAAGSEHPEPGQPRRSGRRLGRALCRNRAGTCQRRQSPALPAHDDARAPAAVAADGARGFHTRTGSLVSRGLAALVYRTLNL